MEGVAKKKFATMRNLFIFKKNKKNYFFLETKKFSFRNQQCFCFVFFLLVVPYTCYSAVAKFPGVAKFRRLRNFWIFPSIVETKQKPAKISQEKLNKDA